MLAASLTGLSPRAAKAAYFTYHNKYAAPSDLNPGKNIFLTVDDGPMDSMKLILKHLDAYNAKCTFFCVGRMLKTKKGQDLARKALDKGHALANHSYNHPNFHRMKNADAIDEVERTHELIIELLNQTGISQAENGTFFRFPFGLRDKRVVSKLNKLGYGKDFKWDQDTKDWQHYNGRSIELILKDSFGAHKGNIILCHDRFFTARKLIKPILKHYDKYGLKFKTLTHYTGKREWK